MNDLVKAALTQMRLTRLALDQLREEALMKDNSDSEHSYLYYELQNQLRSLNFDLDSIEDLFTRAGA